MKAKPYITIYKATNLVNGKCYVGQTNTSAANRFSQHWYDANTVKKRNPFHKALRKYGREAFRCEPLIICELSEANYYEAEVLKMLDCFASNGKGYNVADPNNHFRSIGGLKGEKHPASKLSERDVLAIRSDVGLSSGLVAKKYGVSLTTVKRIRNGSIWSHVAGVMPSGSYTKYKASGERHHACILNDEHRAAIKADRTTTTRELSSRYGVSKHVIFSIRGAQPQIVRQKQIDESAAQYILDHPEVTNSALSGLTGVSVAQISRIKSGKQFSHLKSLASAEQWAEYERRKNLYNRFKQSEV